MEKILLLFDNSHADINLIGFACYIADITHAVLRGALVEDPLYVEQLASSEAEQLPYEESKEMLHLLRSRDASTAAADKLQFFREACLRTGIRHETCRLSANEALEESRFSDLIITDARLSADHIIERTPSDLIKNLLMLAECPILIAPSTYQEFDRVVHCYDGSKSSVFAIKQFTYQFPELTELKCILLHVNKADGWTMEKEEVMKRWLKAHYSQCGSEILHGNVESALQAYLASKTGALVTMGAYGRSMLSLAMRESRSNGLMRKMEVPVFISHQ